MYSLSPRKLNVKYQQEVVVPAYATSGKRSFGQRLLFHYFSDNCTKSSRTAPPRARERLQMVADIDEGSGYVVVVVI